MNNKSFTLIELLVVIVIIGILAGVIMISTSSSIDKASIAKLKVFEESVSNNLADSMVSRWKLDQINYPAVNQTPDAWGNNTGTLINSPILKTGNDCVADGCLIFNGSTNYVEIPDNLSLRPGIKAFTISLWFLAPNQNQAADLMAKRQPISPFNILGLYVGTVNTSGTIDASKKISFWVRNSGTAEIRLCTPNDVANNRWHFLTVLRYNDSHKLYIDGSEITLTQVLKSGTGPYNIDNTYPYFIGGGASFFTGSIDDIKIYDAALSSSQIKQNYIAGLDSLLSKGSISKEDYNQRVNDLAHEQ